MKKLQQYLLSLCLMILGIVLNAQTPIPSTTKTLVKETHELIRNASASVQSNQQSAAKAAVSYDAGATAGITDVSPTGAITYTVPIMTPPGIKDIKPEIALSYNGQGSSGIAGYGWNISGLSTITRVSSTLYHDGFVDPVDFDNRDRFALDGQRLLRKSGTYGVANSTYQTENHSNILIKAFGTSPYGASYGPSYFIVTHPDGTRVWYGNSENSRSKMEWSIWKMQDPQGNFISYNYTLSNNLLRISTINYGSKTGKLAPNKIQFYYKTKQRKDQVYAGGQSFTRSDILDRIEVRAGSTLYRKYQLKHKITSLGYEIVSSVSESNSQGKKLAPVTFSYDSSVDAIRPYTTKGQSIEIFPGVNYKKHQIVSGDFLGNGRMDMMLYDKTKRDALYLFESIATNEPLSIATKIPVSKFTKAFTTTFINDENKLLSQQAVTTVIEGTKTIKFNSYIKTTSGGAGKTTKTWNAPTYNSDSSCNSHGTKTIPKNYITGDFNGDGITDLLAYNKPYNQKTCEVDEYNELCAPYTSDEGNPNLPVPSGCCDCSTNYVNNTNLYFIDLNQQKTTNFVNYVGNLGGISIESTDRMMAADFDGDGKSELFHFSENKLNVYVLDKPTQNLRRVESIVDTNIKMKWPILLGDYNGDGKTDFATPTGQGSTTWRFFLANGSDYLAYSQNIGVWFGENGDSLNGHIFPGEDSTFPHIHKLFEYHYRAQDFNGDGRSDILSQHVITSFESNDRSTVKLSLYVNRFKKTDTYPSFEPKGYQEDNSNSFQKFGIPIFMDLNTSSQNAEFAYVDGNNIYGYEFLKDHRKDVNLRSITNNGITTAITYDADAVDEGRGSIYGLNYDAKYPYRDIQTLNGIKLVRELKQTGSGITRYRKFAYNGGKTHLTGLGFLGFRAQHRTNWHGDGVGTLWTNSIHDSKLRGLVTEEWVATSAQTTPFNYISKKNNTYTSSLATNKRFKVSLEEQRSEDVLTGVTTKEVFTYDSYLNPTKRLLTFPGGSKTVTYKYSNSLLAADQTYHVGRLKEQKEVAVLKGESFTTTKLFMYSNNLLTKEVNQGNGTQQRITEYTYDSYGNITTKNEKGNQVPKKETYTYDTSGRYQLTRTDHLGRKTINVVNTTYGTLTSVTNPYKHKTSFTYDNWQREISAANYLGKKTLTSYIRQSDGGIKTKVDLPQGKDAELVTNAFGWKVYDQELSIKNKYHRTSYQYDVTGRTTAVSEPYFSTNSPNQWNRSYYDAYGRMIRQQLYTGKDISTTYDKLKITVNDGTKTTSVTKDAVGNIVYMTDPGGTIAYTYYANASMKVADYGGHRVTTKIDQWGRKTEMNDPSAGRYTYSYNTRGELVTETTPNNGVTTHEYLSNGLPTKKILRDNSTLSTTTFHYFPNGWLPHSKSYKSGGNLVDVEYIYYQYTRFSGSVEYLYDDLGNEIEFFQNIKFDDYGRIASEKYSTDHYTNDFNSVILVKNKYDSAGILVEKTDGSSNQSLWKITNENHRGQITRATLGNGFTMNRLYDTYGNPKEFRDTKTVSNVTKTAFHSTYNFDAKRGILKDRNNLKFNRKETFSHDSLDRLTKISGAVSQSVTYQPTGLTNYDSEIGNYKYKAGTKKYQTDRIELSVKGKDYYLKNKKQQVDFDGFKRPIKIVEDKKGEVYFGYGPNGQRSFSYFDDKNDGKIEDKRYNRFYSSIIPVEIHVDTSSKQTKIISYVNGDAYTAPIAHLIISGIASLNSGYHYIHRDYLGSVIALTNKNGDIIEQTHFGAWGSVDIMKNVTSSIPAEKFSYNAFLGRGFTGHEHFSNVSIVHMNGRLYDPKLRRFLSPDNHIQDPYNTQSFNRYSYVWNNPLTLSDPTGEIIPLIVIGVGVLVGAYVGGAQANGSWNPLDWDYSSGDTWAGIGIGGLVGGVSGGVGFAAAGAVTAAGGSALVSAMVGGVAGGAINGGFMTLAPGGNGKFFQGLGMGALTGAFSGAAGHLAVKFAPAINGISSPALKSLVGGAVGGFAGGYAGGFVGGLIGTGDFSLAHQAGMGGAQMGAAIGAVSSFAVSYSLSRASGTNFFTGKANSVSTPYGDAIQSNSPEALKARNAIQSGEKKLYRIGTIGKSQTAEAQFWATENPISNPKAFAQKYGIPIENIQNANFIETGTLKAGTNFITRPAPPAPGNPVGWGGGIEVVTPPNSVKLESFNMLSN